MKPIALQHKNVVITGAGSGIGRALAMRAAELGARLALCDVNQGSLDATRDAAEASGARVVAVPVDVSQQDHVEAFAETVRASLGPADVLINNAGVSLSETAARMTTEDFAWLMNINFWGVVHGCKAFLPQLISRPRAHLVNISSVFGIIGVPTQAAYSASKFAVRGYTETLRQELAHTGVRVTCVHPGGVRTNIVRSGRQYTSALGGAATTEEMAARFERMARTSPEAAARAIIAGAVRGRPRVLIGNDALLIDIVQRLMPVSYDRVTRALLRIGEKLGR